MTASGDRPVLIVTTTIDLAADRVVDQLLSRSVPTFRLNTDRLPYASGAQVRCSSGASLDLTLHEAGRTVRLENVRSFWYRRVRMPAKPEEASEESHEYVFREAVAVVRGMLEILASRVRSFGSPCVLERAESKIYQLELARALDFETPLTLVSSDAGEIRRFAAAQEQPVIAKPVHSGYVRTTEKDLGIFTQRLDADELSRLGDALPCPIIVQEEVPKLFDVRATVVRGEVFAATIDSQSDPAAVVDWRRTSRADLPHHRHELPMDIRGKCLAMAERLGTGFAGIDLVLTPDGRYVFLESNPNGEWLWIEDLLDYPISDAIVAYLEGAR